MPRGSTHSKNDGPDGASEERIHEGDLTPIVGANLRRLRLKRGLSLERLGKASGVSRAMLGQIELGQSTPTINVLWKIARALAVPFSTLITESELPHTALMPRSASKVLLSADRSFSTRALFPVNVPRSTEFYELRMAPLGVEKAVAHPSGTTENIVVASGAIQIRVDKELYQLGIGDAILFDADVPHTYVNPSAEVETLMFLVMTYSDAATRAR